MDATLSSDGQYYIPSGGQVTLTDPGHPAGRCGCTSSRRARTVRRTPTGWSSARALLSSAQISVAPNPTPADPAQVADSVTALDYRTGHADWQQAGDPGDPMSLSAVTAGPGLVRAVTSHQDVETYAADGGVTESTAGPGDFLSAATASITAPGSTDLVAGDENGDVYALDGRSLAAGTEQVLWRAHLPGPVQDIVTATLGGRQVLVAAATSAIGVLDASTGRLLRLIPTPGTFAYTATVISVAGTPAVVVPGSSLTAYALTTGARLWSHAAPSGAWFSDAAYADGVVAAEYSSAANGATPAAEMAAVGVSAATGNLVWSQRGRPVHRAARPAVERDLRQPGHRRGGRRRRRLRLGERQQSRQPGGRAGHHDRRTAVQRCVTRRQRDHPVPRLARPRPDRGRPERGRP